MKALLVVLAACSGTATPPIANRTAEPAPTTAPNLDELVALLKPHAAFELAPANEYGCPADETLGAWTARLIEYGSPKNDGDLHELTGGCGPFVHKMNRPPPPPADQQSYWYCSIDGYSSDPAGESPWSCGLIVRVKKADRSVDLSWLGCPGTC